MGTDHRTDCTLDRPLDELPAPFAVALRLVLAGYGEQVVADALGVPLQSVPTLLELARAKLARLEDAGIQ